MNRAAFGEPRGKGASLGDVVAVGRVFVREGLLKGGRLTPAGELVVDVALGRRPRSQLAHGGTKGAQVLVAKVERALRRAGIVEPARERPRTKRHEFTDTDGQKASHAYIVEGG